MRDKVCERFQKGQDIILTRERNMQTVRIGIKAIRRKKRRFQGLSLSTRHRQMDFGRPQKREKI
jgi:predicted transcriptional regulator